MSGPLVSSKCLPKQDYSGYVLLAFALDGTGAGTILEALAQCCKATGDGTDVTVTVNIARTKVALQKDVSSWPSRCKIRLRDMTACAGL